jgi:hypothetical protein
MENLAYRIRARAIRRAGELLRQIDGRGGDRKTDNFKSISTNTFDQKQAAEKAGMSKRQQVTAVRVANVPESEFENQIESDNPPTITTLAEQGLLTNEQENKLKRLKLEAEAKLGRLLAALERGKTGPKLPDTLSDNTSEYTRVLRECKIKEREAQRATARMMGVSHPTISHDLREWHKCATRNPTCGRQHGCWG